MSAPNNDPLQRLKESIRVIDATDDAGWLAAARWEVAVGYSKLANPAENMPIREIYKSICQDGYEREARSRTLAALSRDPQTGQEELAATVRMVLGRERRSGSEPFPIDAMNFVVPVDEWPHRRSGVSDDEVAELGRFVIVERYRSPEMRRENVDSFVTAALVREARRIARARGVSLLYGLMPARVAEINLRGGVGLTEVPILLKSEHRHASAVFETFSLYWKRLDPRLFVMHVSAQEIAETFASTVDAEGMLRAPAIIAERFLRNVSAVKRDVPVVLRPPDEASVASIVHAANESRIPIYPFSTGKNWGLGSKLPVTDDCVLVDLSRMNRILRIDEEFGYAILEPGVTQLQLARCLNERHPAYTLNFTGSFAHTGIVGNVLERGDGAHARVDDLLGVRGILGSGRAFAVGGFWENVDSERPSHVLRHTAGPDLPGLFCQSGFGVVTQLAFRLDRKPESRAVIWGRAAPMQLAALVDAIDSIAAKSGIRRDAINIGYANRFVQARPTMASVAAESDLEEGWAYYLMIGGTRRATEVLAQEIATALATHSIQTGIFRYGSAAGDHDRTEELPAFLRPLVGPLLGLPDAESIRTIYELTQTPFPTDERALDADHTPFGMKCYIGIVPPRGRYVERAAAIVGRLRGVTGLNLKASFFGDGRSLITIHFRTDDAEQVNTATACEGVLWDEMNAAGFGPYRAAIDQMERLVVSRADYFDLIAELKSALDPNGILAPGRYCPTLRGNRRMTSEGLPPPA